MQLKFDASHPNNKEIADMQDSVYVMELDKTKFDPAFPNYEQIHLLRFEIDKSKGADKKTHMMKITDIDYWLEGNRHAVAHSREFMEGNI